MSFLAEKLRYGYKNGPEYADISLCLAPGSLNAVIGPNGCGKSALLRALAGVLPLKAGRLSLRGLALNGLSRRERARCLAYVPQHSPPSGISVYQALLIGRTPYMTFAPSKKDKAAVEAVLERLKLRDRRERPLEELSGGERRRALLGVALAQDTPVLLLDEPAAGLDPRQQMEIYGLLRKLALDEGKIILSCEHNLNLAARYCDLLLSPGPAAKPEKTARPATPENEDQSIFRGSEGIKETKKTGGLAICGPPAATLTPAFMRAAYGIEAEIVLSKGEEPRPRILDMRESAP